MSNFGLWLFRLMAFVPPLLLALMAAPRLQSGLVLDTAFPATLYMSMDVALPPEAYAEAERRLAHVAPEDGGSAIARAQAAALSGRAGAVDLAEAGLARAPASAWGWTVIAEISDDPVRGPAALEMALRLAPFDPWLAGRRVEAGAFLWDVLAADARDLVLRQARIIWIDSDLHGQVRPLLRTPQGGTLVTRAFAEAPEDLRGLNRWVARTAWRESLGR